MTEYFERFDLLGNKREFPKDGEPCSHPGCLSHISHPCEGCGRIGGHRRTTEQTEQHEWGPWHPWCSTYRCIHPGCYKNMPSEEVAKRLNEYETQNNTNADLLEVLIALVDRCRINNRFPDVIELAEEVISRADKP